MADLFWVGDIDTDFLKVNNYRTTYNGSTVPTIINTTDTIYFTDMGQQKCVLSGATTIGSLVWEDKFTEVSTGGSNVINVQNARRFEYEFELNANLTVDSIILNGQITTTGTGNQLIFTNIPTLLGDKYILFAEYGEIDDDVEMYINPASTTTFYLDNGKYGIVEMNDGIYRPQYSEPTYKLNKRIEISKLIVNSGMTIEPTSPMQRKDRDVYFLLTSISNAFDCFAPSVDFGRATFAICGRRGGSATQIPHSFSSSYGGGSDFSIRYGALRIYAPDRQNTPYVAEIGAGLKLCVNHLIVDSGAMIQGGANAEIECVSLPIINGSLGNFMQINDGLYRVSPNAILTCGLLSYRYGGTGLSTLGSANQVLATNATGTAIEWQTVSGGGGGSGTVTSVDMTVPTGFTISGNPITTAGTLAISYSAGYSLPTTASQTNWDTAYGWGDHASAGYLTSYTETDPIFTASEANLFVAGDKSKLDNIEPNADVTDATNVASAGAIMDSDFSANGLMERTGSGSYTVNTDIIQTEHLAIDYATGWWTFAVVKGWDALGGSSSQRAMSQFYIQDKRSSRHRTARIEASHQFGVDGSNSLTCFAVSGYGNEIPFTEFRIKEGSTYDGAALQMYISNSLNDLTLHMIFNLGTGDGWTLLGTMLADSDTAGHDALLGDTSRTYVDFATSMTVKKTIDIEETGFVDANAGGGMVTTGGLVVQGSTRVGGTLRQSVTNAVLVADANGDLASASNLQDIAYAPAIPEVCVVNLLNDVPNFTPTGAYTLLQQTGNWSSTNPNFDTLTGLYTVPTDGIYRISWQVSFRYTPVGQLQASRIFVNGSSAAQGPTGSSGAWPLGSGSVLLTLSAGDTVGLYVYISTTGTTLVGDITVPFSNHMSINKVSN